MNVFDEILEWSRGLPDWQSDAVRRIWIKGDLEEDDRKQVLDMLKISKGIHSPSENPLKPERLTQAHMPASEESAEPVVLVAVRDLSHVNAIAPAQVLRCAPDGLTIVYGDNATGKSGYSRVLKKACRAGGQAEAILPNGFVETSPGAPAEAMFDIIANGQPCTEKWVNGQTPPDRLSHIAVFDSKAARFYVDERNEVVYVPYGLDLFTKLGKLLGDLKTRLQNELTPLQPLPKELTNLDGRTAVGRLIQSISYQTDLGEIEKLAKLKQQDLERLGSLERLVKEVEAKDPKSLAVSCRRLAKRIGQLRTGIILLDSGLSAKKCEGIALLHKCYKAAAEAARLALMEAFGNQPLAGVGSEAWREMFEAARRYSEKEAYVGLTFPVTDADGRCVFCQQLLDRESAGRIRAFEDFIKEDTERKSKELESALETEWDEKRSLKLHPEESDPTVLDEIGEIDPDSRTMVLEYLESAEAVYLALKQGYETGDWTNIPALNATPAGRLSELAGGLESKALTFDSASQPEGLGAVRHELEELLARNALSSHKAEVVACVEKVLHHQLINACIDATNTLDISRQGKRLMDELLTSGLRKRMEDELALLGAGHIKIDVGQETRAGTTFHYLKLAGVVHGQVSVSSVLSYGEQRAVAIASFLSQVPMSIRTSGIVFDDPVSSLDHRWRDKVATRLAKEGKSRQVIIFTHDLVFVMLLCEHADQEGVGLLVSQLDRNPSSTGICRDGPPWFAMSVKGRIGVLKERCQQAKRILKTESESAYEEQVRSLYRMMRETWERGVEELLLNKVVQRFRRGIETKRIAKLVDIDKLDYDRIEAAMTRCSNFAAHDEAPEVKEPLPSPDDLDKDVKELEDWVSEMRERGRS